MGPMLRALGGWRVTKRAAYLAALALAGAALLHPVTVRTEQGIDYLVVFDVSLSMATEDYRVDGIPTSRLDVARAAFRRVVRDLPPHARITLAGFAGNTVQVFLLRRPVRDLEAIEAALAVLEWDNIWDVGSRLDLVMRDVVAQSEGSTVFRQTGRRPVLPRALNIVFFTDGGGEDVRHSVGADATSWFTRHARVTFVGVGRPQPSPVPQFTRARPRDCLRDVEGACLTSSLNELNLQKLAEWLAGRYEPLRDVDRLREIFLDEPLTGEEARVPHEIGWILGLASLGFFLVWVLL